MLTPFVIALPSVLLAAQQSGGGSGGLFGLLLPLVLIGLVFYFFIYRPQQKREQEHQEMIDNLERGDKIVTIGGIHGTVQRIDDDSILVQIDSKGTKIRLDKQAVSSSGEETEG